MSARDPWRAVKMWIRLADGDLRAAELLADAGKVPGWLSIFHAQQCCEKYLKALLSFLGIPFRKSHDIGELFDLLPAEVRPSIEEPIKQKLTYFAAVGRYSDEIVAGDEDVKTSLTAARDVRNAVRGRLPPEAVDELP